MVLLPVILLILGALATWYARTRQARVLWGLSVGTALLAWLVSLGLILLLPQVTRISVWQPQALFQSQLELRLDRVSWPFLYATSTVLLAIIFTHPARTGETLPGTRALILAYTTLPMIAILAGNMLTIATAWAVMDVFTLLLFISIQEDEKAIRSLITRLLVDGGSVILVLAAALVNVSQGGDTSMTSQLRTPLVAILLAVASLLRLGLLPLHFSLPPLPRLRRELGTLLRLLPPSAALSVLARLINLGLPLELLPWLRLVGGIGIFIGGLRWALETDVVAARPFLVLAISGQGVLIASSSSDNGNVIVAAGVLLLLVGTVLSVVEIFTPIHRLWPGLCGLVLAGLPGTPGSVLSSALIVNGFDIPQIVSLVLGVLGMVLLSVGALRLFFLPSVPWPTAESLVRFVYGLGLGLPVLVAVGLGFWMWDGFSLQGFILFMVATILAAFTIINMRRLPLRDLARWGKIMVWLDPTPIYNALASGSRAVMRVVRATSGVMEGEGAMLWLFVILLLLFLGLRSTP